MDSAPQDIAHLLRSLQIPAVLVDRRGAIVHVNSAAQEMCAFESSEGQPLSCFETFLELQEPCPDCPAHRHDDAALFPVRRRANRRQPSGDRLLLQLSCQAWEGGEPIVISLRDVTKEVRLIEEFAYLKKEILAKDVLARRKDEQIAQCQEMLSRVWDIFPGGLAMIDTDFSLKACNPFWAQSADQAPPSKCYDLFGHDKPCPGCRARDVRNSDPLIIGHRLKTAFFTETCVPFEDGEGALLILRDSTKQVELIEKIRRQRDTIQRQKDLFSNLANLMGLMHQESDCQKIAAVFLQSILTQLGTKSGLVLIDGFRKGNLWLHASDGMTDEEVSCLEAAYLSRLLRRNEHSLPAECLPGDPKQWAQVPLLSGGHGTIGILFLRAALDADRRQILTLFLEPMRAFLNNRLLSMRLEEQANTDSLTGLFNRNYFERTLADEIGKAKNYDIPFTLVIGDANGLKEANDTHGHQAGDRLIKAFAEHLRAACRETDVVARIGGDEFCIILPNTGLEAGSECVRRIRAHLEDKCVTLPDGTQMPLSISLGWAGSDQTPAEVVFKTADHAMYEEKRRHHGTREQTQGCKA